MLSQRGSNYKPRSCTACASPCPLSYSSHPSSSSPVLRGHWIHTPLPNTTPLHGFSLCGPRELTFDLPMPCWPALSYSQSRTSSTLLPLWPQLCASCIPRWRFFSLTLAASPLLPYSQPDLDHHRLSLRLPYHLHYCLRLGNQLAPL